MSPNPSALVREMLRVARNWFHPLLTAEGVILVAIRENAKSREFSKFLGTALRAASTVKSSGNLADARPSLAYCL